MADTPRKNLTIEQIGASFVVKRRGEICCFRPSREYAEDYVRRIESGEWSFADEV